MMTQSKSAVLCSALLMTLFSLFGVSAEPDKGKSFPDLKENIDFSNSESQNRWKRMTNLGPGTTGSDMYQPEDLNSFVGLAENEDDDIESRQDSEYPDLNKKASSFVRIGKLYPMNRFIRIGRVYAEPRFDDFKYPDNSDDEKRSPQFVRIGKAPSSFVRIGKSESDDTHEELDKRASSFVRIGKAPSSFVRIGRAPSSFVRIGKPYSQYVDSTDGASGRLRRESQFDRTSRGPSNFVRIGKAPSNFVRIGKAPSSFVRIGKAPSSFVRIGKAPSSFVRIGKAPSSFVRIGKAPSSFVRIGKAPSSFVRIGKADSNFQEKSLDIDSAEISDFPEKRTSSFVRIGKAPSSFVRIGKAPSSFVRIGKSDLSDSFFKQPQSSIGEAGESPDEEKRASSFVRIGKSPLTEDTDERKRASSFVRIGKAEPTIDALSDLNKQGSSFDPFAKTASSDNAGSPSLSPADHSPASSESLKDGNFPSSDEPIKISTRGSAFVRIGKIPSSAFVRIGKNNNHLMEQDDYNRRARGNQSSFVRIGK